MMASSSSNVTGSAVDYVQNVAFVGQDNHKYPLRFFRSRTSNPAGWRRAKLCGSHHARRPRGHLHPDNCEPLRTHSR